MADAVIPTERSPLLTRGFSTLLVAQACFGYAFSSFFLLPKYLVVALDAGPTQVGWSPAPTVSRWWCSCRRWALRSIAWAGATS